MTQPPEGLGGMPVSADRPMVTLDWSLWCARHLEPYRAQWPKGASLAMLRLFDAAVRMPAVIDACGHPPGDPDHADTANLTVALERFKPVCCFVGKEAMTQIYAETLPQAQP